MEGTTSYGGMCSVFRRREEEKQLHIYGDKVNTHHHKSLKGVEKQWSRHFKSTETLWTMKRDVRAGSKKTNKLWFITDLAVCFRNFNDDTSKEVTVNEKYLCMSDRVSRVMVLILLNKREAKLQERLVREWERSPSRSTEALTENTKLGHS